MSPKALVTSIHKSAQGTTNPNHTVASCLFPLPTFLSHTCLGAWFVYVHMLVILRGCACTGYAHLHLPVHMNLLAYTYTHAYAHVRMRACVRKYESCNETDG